MQILVLLIKVFNAKFWLKGDENITRTKMILMAHKSNQWLGASVRTFKDYILVSLQKTCTQISQYGLVILCLL